MGAVSPQPQHFCDPQRPHHPKPQKLGLTQDDGADVPVDHTAFVGVGSDPLRPGSASNSQSSTIARGTLWPEMYGWS